MEKQTTLNENQANVQDYLKYLPLMLLFGLVKSIQSYCSVIYIQYLYKIESLENVQSMKVKTDILFNIIFHIFIWFFIAKTTKSNRNALFAGALSIIINLLLIPLSKTDFLMSIGLSGFFLIFLGILPFLLFGLLEFNDKRTLVLALLGLAITSFDIAFLGSGYVERFLEFANSSELKQILQVEYITDYNPDGSKRSLITLSLPVIFSILSIYTSIMLVCSAVVHHLKYFGAFHDKLIEFYNDYKIWQRVVVFLILKTTIPVFAIGCAAHLQPIIGIFREDNQLQRLIAVAPMLLSFFSALICIYFIVWFFRKFLLEILYGNKEIPSWNVWLVLTPYIGWLFFLILYLFSTKCSKEERIELFNNSDAKNNSKQIATFTIVFQLLLLLYSMLIAAKADESVVLTMIMETIPIAFFIFFISNPDGIKFVFIGQFVLLLLPLFSKSVDSEGAQNHIITTCNLYLLYSVFHIYQFEYLSTPSETNEYKIDEHENIIDSGI